MQGDGAGYQVHLEKDPSFLREIWAWFVIGLVTITLRWIVRIRTVGFRGLAGDDYITFLTLGFYTMDAVLVHIVYHTGANAGLTQDIVDQLSQEEIDQFVLGSACQTAAWYSYTALIWCMKFTMLFFYKRLTFGTLQNRMIKYLFWLCGVTYLAVVLTITFGCFPFEDNWAVAPTLPSRKCTFKTQNLLVTVTLNVITDAAILVIPIPMLWRLKVATSRKLAIAALLSSGVFVIGAAITRAALTLGEAPSALNINRWGVRETIVGIVAVQLPLLRPLFVREFWRRGRYMAKGGGSGGVGGGSTSDVRTGTHGTVTLGSGRRNTLSKKGYEDGGVGAIELHSQAGSDVVDLERASTYSKEQPLHITMVELLERDKPMTTAGAQVVREREREHQSRGPSVSSGDGSEDGFVRRDAHRQQCQQQQQQRPQLGGGGGGGGGGGQQGSYHGHQQSVSANNMVFVETTYEIRSEGRRTRDDGDGAARGEVGCDTRITATRGWGR